MNPILQKSLRRLIKIALFIASSSESIDNYGTAHGSHAGLTPHYLGAETFESEDPVSFPKAKTPSVMWAAMKY